MTAISKLEASGSIISETANKGMIMPFGIKFEPFIATAPMIA